MAFADYTSQGAVAVITLKNSPVNALGQGLRAAVPMVSSAPATMNRFEQWSSSDPAPRSAEAPT